MQYKRDNDNNNKNSKQVEIYTGAFGSGKTEIAINRALELSRRYAKVVLVDLDIVNPYFRSRERRHELAMHSVEVICPRGELEYSELPALPAAISWALQHDNNDREAKVILDVGGDDSGARVLGRYNEFFREADYRLYLVVNARRPATDTKAKILELVARVEQAAKLKVTALISNTNLAYATTVDVIRAGHALIKSAALEAQLPIRFLSVKEDLVAEITHVLSEYERDTTPILPLKLYMELPWREYNDKRIKEKKE